MQNILQMMQGQQQQQGAMMPSPYIPKTEDEQRRDQLRAALAAAGKTMSSTPGNALTGITAGLGDAAQAYQQAGRAGTAEEMAKYRGQQGERQKLMRDMLGGATAMGSAERADERIERQASQDAYTRERNVIQDEAKAERDKFARENAERTQVRLEEAAEFSEADKEFKRQKDLDTAERADRKEKRATFVDAEKLMGKYRDQLKDDFELTAEQRKTKEKEYRKILNDTLGGYGIKERVKAPGTSTKAKTGDVRVDQGKLTQPKSPRKGQTIINDATGERMQWNGESWVRL